MAFKSRWLSLYKKGVDILKCEVCGASITDDKVNDYAFVPADDYYEYHTSKEYQDEGALDEDVIVCEDCIYKNGTDIDIPKTVQVDYSKEWLINFLKKGGTD